MQLVYLYKCTKMINKTKLYRCGFLPALFYNFVIEKCIIEVL